MRIFATSQESSERVHQMLACSGENKSFAGIACFRKPDAINNLVGVAPSHYQISSTESIAFQSGVIEEGGGLFRVNLSGSSDTLPDGRASATRGFMPVQPVQSSSNNHTAAI